MHLMKATRVMRLDHCRLGEQKSLEQLLDDLFFSQRRIYARTTTGGTPSRSPTSRPFGRVRHKVNVDSGAIAFATAAVTDQHPLCAIGAATGTFAHRHHRASITEPTARKFSDARANGARPNLWGFRQRCPWGTGSCAGTQL